jgi:glucokinase
MLRGLQIVQRNLAPSQQARLLAVGISCPGFIHEGGIVTAVNLGWQNFPLAEKMKEATRLPVFLHTACRAYVLAECRLGRAQGCDNCIYIEVGKGIGAGIVVDGRYLEGRDKMAGELGHLTIEAASADRCNCGKKGCLEAIASSSAIVRQYCEASGIPASGTGAIRLSDIFENARKNEPIAVSVLDRASKSLAIGIAHLIMLFNPALIVLGGDLLQGEDLLLPRIKREIPIHLPGFTKEPEVTVTSLGLDIGLKGTAFLAFQNSVNNQELIRKLCAPAADAITA